MSGATFALPVERFTVAAYRIPTDGPEADGTLKWDSTTLVLVHAEAGGVRGLGYTYGNAAVAALIRGKLGPALIGRDAFAIPAAWQTTRELIRNSGRPGLCSMAIAAIDISLWDLKAKALGLPLIVLLGAARNSVPAYGSGGFTTYTAEQLQTQLGGWAAAGLPAVKIKIGADISTETARLTHARDAIGENVELYVDANGAYRCKQALAIADVCADFGVSWFEEPVSSDDLDGLRLIRNRAPPGVDIAAGEYGYDAYYFRRMLGAGAVDVLQIDATRCAGFTGFLRAAAVADAFSIPVSPHTAPALHAHVACTLSALRPIELFHDHARIEGMLFDGAPELRDGALWPNTTRPGHGLELRQADAARFELAT